MEDIRQHNVVPAPAVCWVHLMGCTSLTTMISIKDLHKTSKCLCHHLPLNHSKSCSSCTVSLGLLALGGPPHPTPPPLVLSVSHLLAALLWGGGGLGRCSAWAVRLSGGRHGGRTGDKSDLKRLAGFSAVRREMETGVA